MYLYTKSISDQFGVHFGKRHPLVASIREFQTAPRDKGLTRIRLIATQARAHRVAFRWFDPPPRVALAFVGPLCGKISDPHRGPLSHKHQEVEARNWMRGDAAGKPHKKKSNQSIDSGYNFPWPYTG